ncbi:hypothetical protein CEUSTIGMA_g183.t1 [Chlamydomonas eustigma]|uniref:PDZ domain-containing protein n=1 Tax=Chlamydomonas eustigma TaxID=1157962 RepID=A0A250WPG1_9CHLO|nr:hypothetical protein CEUSTIGMA_g183.t1 [Chlamydomonas eustigma]|eukprot:GAX72727.1 hypothetical protein CEUSTIGMA_g183.t1 [Chlamydomonas eustigma]
MPRRKLLSAAASFRCHYTVIPSNGNLTNALHVLLPGNSILLQSAAVRRTMRPQLNFTWFPFLVGSGAGVLACLGLTSYNHTSSNDDLTGLCNIQPMGLHRSFSLWPWRSASASGPMDSTHILPSNVSHGPLPAMSRPPLLPASTSTSVPCLVEEATSSSTCSDRCDTGAGGGRTLHTSSPPFTRISISEAAAKAAPSVVHLVVAEPASGAVPSAYMGPSARSTGSGVLYHSSGYILTNAHVVMAASMEMSSNAPPLMVTTNDGQVFRGRVINIDKASDVAVVKIDSPTPLPVAEFASSSDLRLGAWVVALGSPLMLKHSVTAGIISCVERRGAELGLNSAKTGYIQTDAAINQGSSGGPLCNLDGEVVGINNMKAVAADGVSFAIPSDAVREIVRQFHLNGRVIRPYIGISMLEVGNGGLKQLRERVPAIPASAQSAVVIQRVVEGSPAMEAGLKVDDLIITVAGKQHLCMASVIEEFSENIGKRLELQVMRKSEEGDYKLLNLHMVPVEASA